MDIFRKLQTFQETLRTFMEMGQNIDILGDDDVDC